MKYLLFALPLLSIACEKEESDNEESVSIYDLDGDIESGETLYISNCSGCHSADATGGVGPNILDKEEEAFISSIQEGLGSMPAFPDLLDQDIADIIAYVYSL